MPGERGLAEPGRPGEQQVVDGLVPLARRLEHDRQVLLEFALADELVERPGPQTGFDLEVAGQLAVAQEIVGRARCSDRGTRHARRAPNDFSASRSNDGASASPDRSRRTSRTSSVP